jgi:hypothetical protein
MNVMEFDPERVLINVRQATTEDLLDRVTVFRAGMEPEAIEIIEGELQDRGVYRDQIRAHGLQRDPRTILLEDGTAAMCSFCHRPAAAQAWGWHWLSIMAWGKRRPIVPLFPRYFNYCKEHIPKKPASATATRSRSSS